MARQSMHSRRAGRGATNTGASWISYSDMMASIVLIFVLILCVVLYTYMTLLEQKVIELDEQKALVTAQQQQVDTIAAQLAAQQVTLDEQTAALLLAQTDLANAQAVLTAQKAELDTANAALATRETELTDLQAQLANQQMALDAATEVLNAQKEIMGSQASKIDALMGIRTTMVAALTHSLSASGFRASVDKATGDIMLESAVFFEFNSAKLSKEGADLLDRFLPAYMGVLLSDEYRDYLGEIIIEGHTDNVGEYLSNLELSQERAQTVVMHCLTTDALTAEQRELLRTLIVPKGKSFTDPVYGDDGTIDQDRSRRVEFKFRLRDAEMIDQLNSILQQVEIE